jgi:hypothetical protein
MTHVSRTPAKAAVLERAHTATEGARLALHNGSHVNQHAQPTSIENLGARLGVLVERLVVRAGPPNAAALCDAARRSPAYGAGEDEPLSRKEPLRHHPALPHEAKPARRPQAP